MAHHAVTRYVAPALLIVAAGTALTTLSNFSQAQSQPGTPSQTQPSQTQPGQRDRQDRQDATPGNRNNQNQPNQNQPGDRRDNTRQDDREGMTGDDEDFFWRDDRNQRDGASGNRYMAPFTFLSPQSEAGFTERRQRLARMEDRLTQRTDEMIRRLGEIRQMDAARRDDAMLDLMQQMLLDHRRLMLYLRQSRTAWSGDMTDTEMNMQNNQNNQQRPGTTTPGRTGNNGNR